MLSWLGMVYWQTSLGQNRLINQWYGWTSILDHSSEETILPSSHLSLQWKINWVVWSGFSQWSKWQHSRVCWQLDLYLASFPGFLHLQLHCKQSKTGGVEGLGTRLTSTTCHELLNSGMFPSPSINSSISCFRHTTIQVLRLWHLISEIKYIQKQLHECSYWSCGY